MRDVTVVCSVAAAAAAVQPVPLLDIALLAPIHVGMVQAIGQVHGHKLDTKSEHALSAGGFHFLPGKVHHYAFTKVPTVIQVNTNGPFDMTYINPDDDPQKAKK